MNWKIIVIGGLAYYVVVFAVSMITGFVIHEGLLDAAYEATSSSWRPELRADPSEMAALLPMWIFNGLVGALVVAAIYSWIRPAFSGPGWKKGMTYGLMLGVFTAAMYLSLSGVFNFPGAIWLWWSIDTAILFVIGGTVLGIVAEKVAPAPG